MIELGTIQGAEAKVLANVKLLLDTVRRLSTATESLNEGSTRLRQIRAAVYENLNQIQHEHLILQALSWLQGQGFDDPSLTWYWNPRQTGDASEPDLMARGPAGIAVSAEATTSENPVGVIDSRMRGTLSKLNQMAGEKYYFVQSQSMARRARTKISRNMWQIKVVQLGVAPA